MGRVSNSLKHAWNAFTSADRDRFIEDESRSYGSVSGSYGVRPDRIRMRFPQQRAVVSSIYTRLSIDVAMQDIRHVRLDEQNRYLSDVPQSALNNILKVEANLDQAAQEFLQDVVMTMCDHGVAAMVPIDTDLNPNDTGGYNIQTMRVGEVVRWLPRQVTVSVYNEKKGIREEITLDKKYVGLVYNPFFSVMNEPNSTLQRLIRKIALLDYVDEQSSSGKLDIIIQLPYQISSERKRQQAEQRRADIEFQLKGSKYGIAYTDGSEKVTQLNRPAENNLAGQVDKLWAKLYGELGLTEAIMNGTADEQTMLNYWNRTIKAFMGAISGEMKRKFLTKTARSQKQDIQYFRNPFAFISMKDLAEVGDKFTRNEIATSNELRQGIGWVPSNDPKADELRNSNMPREATEGVPAESSPVDDGAAEVFDSVDQTLNEIFSELGVDENANA